MFPIFEQGRGQGIGHSVDSFYRRFIDICHEHLDQHRAKSFAFILYDLQHDAIREIFMTPGAFAQLHNLSGCDISVFFLDTDNKRLMNSFNEAFIYAFDIHDKHNLPFILFFNVVEKEVIDVEVAELQQTKSMFAFKEIYDTILKYNKQYISIHAQRSLLGQNKLRPIKKLKDLALNKLLEWVIDKGLDKADKLF